MIGLQTLSYLLLPKYCNDRKQVIFNLYLGACYCHSTVSIRARDSTVRKHRDCNYIHLTHTLVPKYCAMKHRDYFVVDDD
jgi:hypothetical protein